MSRLNAEQAAAFPDNSYRTSFLSLANDKDFAIVRFAYESIAQIFTDLVHDVPGEDGKKKQIDCLRSDSSEPVINCPLCQAGMLPKKVIYFNVRNEETGEMQLWQRTYAFFEKNMLPIFDEYTKSGTLLCSIPFKIIRSGVKGDTKTSYSFIALPADGMQLADFPESIDEYDAGIIKQFDYAELQNYLLTGRLPVKTNKDDQIKQREVNPSYNNRPAAAPAPTYNNVANNVAGRRTIANNGGY